MKEVMGRKNRAWKKREGMEVQCTRRTINNSLNNSCANKRNAVNSRMGPGGIRLVQVLFCTQDTVILLMVFEQSTRWSFCTGVRSLWTDIDIAQIDLIQYFFYHPWWTFTINWYITQRYKKKHVA